MAKYEVRRTSLCYVTDNKTITNADRVLSFRADADGNSSQCWYGFYDFRSENYRVFPSGADEMYCIEIDAPGDETLNELEDRVRNIIYEDYDEFVRIVEVADDYSCMREMKWGYQD